MISEDEAFWAGIAVATMMLGGGFSMLFLRTLTGEGAIVLALGLMTMALTIQLRARPRRFVEAWNPFESGTMNPTPPIESQAQPEQAQTEPQADQQPSQPQEETAPVEETQPQEVQQPQQPEETTETPPSPEPLPMEQNEEPPTPQNAEEEPLVVF